ncbi:uncharacterized protein MAL13P1.304-like [Aphis gossypii]|uniref:uncharacterized protein MAL13P1.304-like n=1 Tax=Aphis gossypii TaxID=80765 RepID=UPI0021598909|nr:uncharacterized protein MAL13P1.304-like [Aphis gossypii]
MLFAFALTSALAMSAVLGRSSGPIPTQLTFVREERIQGHSDETAQIVDVDGRSSNLKYVMAIQSSSIWTDIKKRSLTIKTGQRLDDELIEKSPVDLSDEELARLKLACHDGLKCVAVDQLLVLKQVREPQADGKLSVRTVITKITQVISRYTKEYHKDVYQYEAVTQSDDPSKVYESVTNIVEDNKELCQIDYDASAIVDDKSLPKNVDGEAVGGAVVNNNTSGNYNTIKNLSVDDGTVNSATIEKEPSDTITIYESSPESKIRRTDDHPDYPDMVIVIAPIGKTADNDGNTKNRSPDHLSESTGTPSIVTDGPNGNEVKAPENGARQGRARGQYRARDLNGTSDRSYEPVSTSGGSGSGTPKADGSRKTRWPRPEVLNRLGKDDQNRRADVVQNNNAIVKNENAGAGGETDSDSDVVTAGSHDHANVWKGFVGNGTFNNGNMEEDDINNGTINEGRIERSSADKGIINVGTVNNGSVNYGTSDDLTNNGNAATLNNSDVEKYLSSVEKMYSTILERLG